MTAQAGNGFDPYRAWLSVTQAHRPLTAYELLRLEDMEDDQHIIRAAAGVQRVAIQAHRHEAPPGIWEKVHGELESAIAILLDPDRKAAYDAALRTHAEPGPPIPDSPVGSPGTPSPGVPDSPAGLMRNDQEGTVPCQQCRRPNPATRRFCSSCGSHLWESCFQCGSLSLAVDRYCGLCGARLAGGIEERKVQLEGVLAKAEQLRQEGRHEEAITLLEPVTKASESRLEQFASRAAERTREYRAEWKGYQAKAEETVEEAERCVADRQYEAAVRVLKRVPPALRSEQMFVLLEEAQARLQEIASLEDELSSAIASRGTLNLLPKVSRLLTLQPNHARALELAERFRERVCRSAGERIANRQYRVARDLVATLPEIVRDEEVEALSQRAAELAWLSDDLRNAPYVDPTLVQVARRLHALSKNDQRVGRLLAEVRRRERIGSADPYRAYPPWASAPDENRLGYPVEWLNGFGRIHIHENMAGRVLVDHPGRLYVACGLAIQGLERAAIQLNLLPKGSQTRLSRIADMLNEDPMAWVNRKRLPRSAWGLDLSTSGLKAVKLVSHGEPGEVVLEQVDVVPHRKILSEALSDDEAQSLIENTIKQFREQNDVKADRICLGLMGRMVLSQRFTMPSLAPEKREKAIAYEARRRIPVPLDEAAWGYVVTASRGGGQSAREEEILLVAARKPQLLRHLSALRSQNVRIDVIQSDFVALHNYLVYDRLGPGPPEDDASAEPRDRVALLDVGSDQTHLVVSSPTSLWHRSSRFGGEQFTRAIVRELQVTVAQAEELKRSPARAESLSRLYAALEPALATLADESRSLIQSFTSHTRAGAIRRICGCGGSFQLHGLLRFLREAP